MILILLWISLLVPIIYLWISSSASTTKRRQINDDDGKSKIFGFFHPYCSGGGGGERVLWKMVQILQSKGHSVVIYTIDPPETDESKLRDDAERRFDVCITKPVQLISLEKYKHYLQPSPYLSLVLESIGTMKLAKQALLKHQPDVYCDTTGCAFTFLVAKWMLPSSTQIMAYVHYPTISTDMMAFELSNQSRSKFRTFVKLLYYWIFAIMYGIVGSLADLVMVNSTWTYNHIRKLWKFAKHVYIVYPPCRVPSSTDAIPKSTQQQQPKRHNTIVSIGQFRPEKDHTLQIQSVAKLLELHPEHERTKGVKLLLIGSCRNDSDQQRVDELKQLVTKLKLQDYVEFNINPPYSELQQSMYKAKVGIHTMRQEHFGIGIVEMMAAGLITIAHNSGGPKTDIVDHGRTGFLATTAEEYATCIYDALTMSAEQDIQIRRLAQESATRFSDEVFDESFGQLLTEYGYASGEESIEATADDKEK